MTKYCKYCLTNLITSTYKSCLGFNFNYKKNKLTPICLVFTY